MFHGFVFILWFVGLCSSMDVTTDLKMTPLVSPTQNSPVHELETVQTGQSELTAPSKCNSGDMVQKTLQRILYIMNKNMEKQSQTSYLLYLLITILEKNTNSLDVKENKIMNEILDTLASSQGPIIEPVYDVLRYNQPKRNSRINKSLCAQALKKILKVTEAAYLTLIDGRDSDNLEMLDYSKEKERENSEDQQIINKPSPSQILGYLVPSSDDEKEQDNRAGHKFTNNFMIINPVNDYNVETGTIPIYIPDESLQSIEYNLVNQVPDLNENYIHGDPSIDPFMLYYDSIENDRQDNPASHKVTDIFNINLVKNMLIHFPNEGSESIAYNLVKQVPHLNKNNIDGNPSFDQLHDDSNENNRWYNSFIQTNYENPIEWQTSKKEIKTAELREPNIEPFDIHWLPERNNHENLDYNIPGSDFETNNINDKLWSYHQNQNVESTTKQKINTGQLVHHPVNKIENDTPAILSIANYPWNNIKEYKDNVEATTEDNTFLPYSNQIEVNTKKTATVPLYSNYNYPYKYGNQNEKNDKPIITQENYYDFYQKPMTNIINDNSVLSFWAPEFLLTVPKYISQKYVPKVGHDLITNENRNWYDQHYIQMEFTTKRPVISIDEVTNPNHNNNLDNDYPFYDFYDNTELTTKTKPLTTDRNDFYPNYNVKPDRDDYDSESNEFYYFWSFNALKRYNPEDNCSNSKNYKVKPDTESDQVRNQIITQNKFENRPYLNLINTDYRIIPDHNDVIIENVTPINNEQSLETTTKVIHIIQKDHLLYHIQSETPPLSTISQNVDVISNKNNINNEVTHPNLYDWDYMSLWNQKYPHYPQELEIIKPNIYGNFPFNQETDILDKGKINIDDNSNYDNLNPMSSMITNYPKGSYHIYEKENEGYDNPWDPNLLSQNSYLNYNNYFPTGESKDIISETTAYSPNDSWNVETVQKLYNSENKYQNFVNNETTTENSFNDSLDYSSKHTNNDELPIINDYPWQLNIEVTTSYPVLLQNVPEDELPGNDNLHPWENDKHLISDGDTPDSSILSNDNKIGTVESKFETFTSSNSKEKFTSESIIESSKTYQTTIDIKESKDSTQTPDYDSLDVINNTEFHFTRVNDNPIKLNQNQMNILKSNGIKPETQVIKLVERKMDDIEKNISTNTDPKMLKLIQRFKVMIKKTDISINDYVQILHTFDVIIEHFKLKADVSKVLTLLQLNSLIDTTSTQSKDDDRIVEMSYLIKSPESVVIYQYFYVNYHISFTDMAKFFSQNSDTSENDELRLIMLLRLSKIADLSPELKKLSNEDIYQLTVKHGILITTNLINSEGILIPLRESTDDIIKIDDTEDTVHNIDGTLNNIKEVRIRVNNKPYHTITTIGDTPINEDKNTPNVDYLNDLRNPFRKIFPMHKLIKATELATERRKYGQLPVNLPSRRKGINKAEEEAELNPKNDQDTKNITRGQSLQYKSTDNDANASKADNRDGDVTPPLSRVDSDEPRKEPQYNTRHLKRELPR